MNESLVSNKIFLYIWSIWFQLNWMKTRRHRPSLIKQWNAITSLLTCRLLGELFGPAHLPGNSKSPNSSTFSYISNHSLFVPFIFIQPKIEFRIDVIFKFWLEMGKKNRSEWGAEVEEDLMIAVPDGLTGQVLAQTWYRLLHCIGNPVQLSRPSVISQTYKFIQFTIVNSQVHSCEINFPINRIKLIELNWLNRVVKWSVSASVFVVVAGHFRRRHERHRPISRQLLTSPPHQYRCRPSS